MIRLSVIIVNYNVKYFLEQALVSIRKAVPGIPAEVFVVDNASTDGSPEMVSQKFPEVHLIQNKQNTGFSAANNQAIRQAKGDYILLLNPDTVLEEDTLTLCVRFMDKHPEAGGLGVKMLDGKGNYLPESKRGFPTPFVAFCKAFGLTALFPKSKIFARYYLGHMDPDQTHEVEVLAGAFMMLRKSVLDEIGLLDEQFFMYGEDIDLSYRIIRAGYKNYYFPEARIIHYKGESTKKGSLNYVRLFYKAMILFARKHFKKGRAGVFTFFIQMAVYLRAIVTVFSKLASRIWLPLLDAGALYGGIYFIKEYWETNIKEAVSYYPREFMLYVVPAYILVWLGTFFFSGGYDRPYRVSKAVRGILVGTVIISAMYGFLNESYRFSRAIILLGASWALVEAILTRSLYHLLRYGRISPDAPGRKRVLIAGHEKEAQRALSLLTQAGAERQLIGFVAPEGSNYNNQSFVGDISELEDLAGVYEADEVIFCSRDIPVQTIIQWMTQLGHRLDFKIVPEDSTGIIGSNSKNRAGDLFAIDLNLSIDTPMSRRNKRVLDLGLCVALLPFLPFIWVVVSGWFNLLKNWFLVLAGKKSWVGYASGNGQLHNLPAIRPGVLTPMDSFPNLRNGNNTLYRVNLLYAKDYTPWKDLNIFWKNFRKLGR